MDKGTPLDELDEDDELLDELLDEELFEDELELLDVELLDEDDEELDGSPLEDCPPQPATSNTVNVIADTPAGIVNFLIALINIQHPIDFLLWITD